MREGKIRLVGIKLLGGPLSNPSESLDKATVRMRPKAASPEGFGMDKMERGKVWRLI